MDRASVARPTDAHSPEGQAQASAQAANALLDRIEQEIARLKRHRPHLDARITKAGHILTAHLAGRPRMQVIRVRTTASGKARLLFASFPSAGWSTPLTRRA